MKKLLPKHDPGFIYSTVFKYPNFAAKSCLVGKESPQSQVETCQPLVEECQCKQLLKMEIMRAGGLLEYLGDKYINRKNEKIDFTKKRW